MDLLSCPQCNMTFKSSLLLEKHREKFCIGGDIGKVREAQTPQDLLEKVKDYKKRQQQLREQRDRQERELLKDIDEEKWSKTPETVEDSEPPSRQRGSNSRAKWNKGHDTHVHHLAQTHGKHIVDIMTENKELERQRKEIDEKLKELASQSKNFLQVEKMLKELKDQEQKNEFLLESMRQQMQILQMEAMRSKNLSMHSDSPLYSSKKKAKLPEFQPHTYIPFYGGGLLSSEISALRLSYLQNGGNDQIILAQIQDLLNEALQLEQQAKQPQIHHHKDKHRRGPQESLRRSLTRDLITLEVENQRLESELVKLQLKKRKDPKFSKTAYSRRTGHLPLYLPENGDHKMRVLKRDIDLLRQELEVQRLRRHIKTSVTQAPPEQTAPSPLPPLDEVRTQTPNLNKQFWESTDGLGPAPYDPIAGFVIFYDFLQGLDSFYRVCRLVVGLCSGAQEMGSPVFLPPVYCEPSSLPSYLSENKRLNVATLAAKQAVPRIRPSPTISLVMELQASGGYDPYGQEVNSLVSRGWVKLDIFDLHNRVISGKWKVPIRILPVNPALTTGEMNGVPQLGNAELYLRIVNARDADLQSSAPISQNNASLYKYPPLAAARTGFVSNVPVQPQLSSYYFPSTQMMYPPYLESTDPPPPSQSLLDDTL
ncbi:coiled-coil domain-containing protein 17-like [Erpetoichthys calabaricus]|uniref:Coiled-coil domain-containing protein 17-like n=1 Tax=Erpetoichthys calabaricus TaxID=27687 RepID=A0A8C4S822_ERPCA|nr:coiled-coil domain-containing protein 17-like [Erpetoichthys calabaricus]